MFLRLALDRSSGKDISFTLCDTFYIFFLIPSLSIFLTLAKHHQANRNISSSVYIFSRPILLVFTLQAGNQFFPKYRTNNIQYINWFPIIFKIQDILLLYKDLSLVPPITYYIHSCPLCPGHTDIFPSCSPGSPHQVNTYSSISSQNIFREAIHDFSNQINLLPTISTNNARCHPFIVSIIYLFA